MSLVPCTSRRDCSQAWRPEHLLVPCQGLGRGDLALGLALAGWLGPGPREGEALAAAVWPPAGTAQGQ